MEGPGQAMAHTPVIAVTGPDRRYPVAWWATSLAIRLNGGKPVHLTPANFRLHEKEMFDGIIIGGGNDIDPGLYKGEDLGLSKIDPERDAFEIEMIEHALDTHLPILGICRGAQLINVVLGGSLYGDIRGMRHLTSSRRTPLPRKTALLNEQSKLGQILACKRCRINSLHHQAIDCLGTGLQAVAFDLDDFIQGIESTEHRFLIGTQWHPEYLSYIGKQRNLFAEFIREARKAPPEVLYD